MIHFESEHFVSINDIGNDSQTLYALRELAESGEVKGIVKLDYQLAFPVEENHEFLTSEITRIKQGFFGIERVGLYSSRDPGFYLNGYFEVQPRFLDKYFLSGKDRGRIQVTGYRAKSLWGHGDWEIDINWNLWKPNLIDDLVLTKADADRVTSFRAVGNEEINDDDGDLKYKALSGFLFHALMTETRRNQTDLIADYLAPRYQKGRNGMSERNLNKLIPDALKEAEARGL